MLSGLLFHSFSVISLLLLLPLLNDLVPPEEVVVVPVLALLVGLNDALAQR